MSQEIALITTVESQAQAIDFISRWQKELSIVHTYIVPLNASVEIDIEGVTVVEGIPGFLDETSKYAMLSAGVLQAYNDKMIYFITVDSFATPKGEQAILKMIDVLHKPQEVSSWHNIANAPLRGFPFKNQEVKAQPIINCGTFMEQADSSAVHDLESRLYIRYREGLIPKGSFFTMSAKNLSFSRKAAPLMMFSNNGGAFADIRAGIVVKKILDHLNLYISVGGPSLTLQKEDVYDRLKEEAEFIEGNECFWNEVDKMVLTKKTLVECLYEVAGYLSSNEEYSVISKTIKLWIQTFSKGTRTRVAKKREEVASINENEKAMSILQKVIEQSSIKPQKMDVKTLDLDSLKKIKRPKGPIKSKQYDDDAVKIIISSAARKNAAFVPQV